MEDKIPKRIRELMDDEELANMRQRTGWATGTVAEVGEDGEEIRRPGGAWIELFNGDGSAGVFGGVRFMWADESVEYDDPWDEDGFEESYAYATQAAAEDETSPPYWYVEEYNEDGVDYGIPAP